MQEPKDSDVEFGSQLLRYGGDIGFICSGFFGAVLLSIGTKKKSLTTTISTIFAGTACANYLTPLVLHFMPASIQDKGKYAVAFMMGYIGKYARVNSRVKCTIKLIISVSVQI